MKSTSLIALSMLSMTACVGGHQLHSPERQSINWRQVISDDDRTRLRHWRESMIAALRDVRQSSAPDVDAEGALLQPDAALKMVGMAPGDYSCRLIKLGAQQSQPHFRSSPPMTCRVSIDGAVLRFGLETGRQRPVGHIYADRGDRMIFLGSLVLADETMAQSYGHDARRDMIGMVERIGPDHWRMLLPSPHFESLFDVIEIKRATNQ